MCTLLALLTPALDGVNFPYLALKGPALKGPALKGTALKGPALKGPALEGPALKGPKTQDFPPSRAFFFSTLIFRTIHLLRHQRRGKGKRGGDADICKYARIRNTFNRFRNKTDTNIVFII